MGIFSPDENGWVSQEEFDKLYSVVEKLILDIGYNETKNIIRSYENTTVDDMEYLKKLIDKIK